jgi:flagellar hook-length control protein FliK
MLSSGMDNLILAPCDVRSPSSEAGLAPAATGPGAAPSFGDYLRQAQTEPNPSDRAAAAPGPSTPSPAAARAQPSPEPGQESGQAAATPQDTASRQRAADARQDDSAGSPQQSPDGKERGKTAGKPPARHEARDGSAQAPAAPQQHATSSGEAAVVLNLQPAAAATLVDATKRPATSTATAVGAVLAGASGDGQAPGRADPRGRALLAAASTAALKTAPAKPAETLTSTLSCDGSLGAAGLDQAATATQAQANAATSGQATAGVPVGAAATPAVAAAVESTAADAPTASLTSGLDAAGESPGELSRLPATQAAATAAAAAAAPAATMAAGLPAHGNRAAKAGEAAAAIDALAPASASSTAVAATAGTGGPGSSRQAPAAATQGSQAADPAAEATAAPIDRARFVQRVEQAVQSMGDSGGSLRLRLSPPELGTLRISLSLRQGELNAHLEVETSAARNLLLDHLGELRDRLAQQNVKIQQFDVDLADRRSGGTGNQAGQFGQHAQPRSGQDGGRWASSAAQSSDVPNLADSAAPQALGGGQLNVVV